MLSEGEAVGRKGQRQQEVIMIAEQRVDEEFKEIVS